LKQSLPEIQTRAAIEILKEIRVKKGLSQGKLAELAKIGRSTVSHTESGYRTPTLFICYCIANALEISLGDVLQEAESRIRKSN